MDRTGPNSWKEPLAGKNLLGRTARNRRKEVERTPGEDRKELLERTLGEDREEPEERTGKNPWRGQERTLWLERTDGEGREESLERTGKNSWKEPLAGKNDLGRRGRNRRKMVEDRRELL